MAVALPTINFSFEELRDRMVRFTANFDERVEASRRCILGERNEFAKTVVEDRDMQRMLKKDIEDFRKKEKDAAETVSKQELEAAEAEQAISEMACKKQYKEEQRAHLLAQIEQTQEAIRKKREIRAAERKALSSQASRNAPELLFWENYLGMRIEGAGVTDHLKFVYTHIVDTDWTNEFSFIVNMVTRDYEVIHCRPKVPKTKVDDVVDKLNESRDFSSFLKAMRQIFKEYADESYASG